MCDAGFPAVLFPIRCTPLNSPAFAATTTAATYTRNKQHIMRSRVAFAYALQSALWVFRLMGTRGSESARRMSTRHFAIRSHAANCGLRLFQACTGFVLFSQTHVPATGRRIIFFRSLSTAALGKGLCDCGVQSSPVRAVRSSLTNKLG